YEAVSYTWGDPTPSETPGLVFDKSHTLPVTESVKSMLRYLRKTFRPRHLWIDAVSLNQDDVAEKSVQVRLMNDIDEQASKVHIWFGEAQA
ncbi:heterokaryon incompatibility, partial [Clohesyomyces aquaticus]